MAQRNRMSRQDRAKQFMPFSALKGYELALREKEKVIVPKMELTEDMAEELDRKLHQIKVRQLVTIIFYSDDVYQKKTGMVSKLETDLRYIKIVNTRISFDDIYDIEFIECAE